MKKFLSLLLVVVLTATLAVGGTLAYLTDRDSKANVFTVGDVSIKLEEDFDQGATLIPGVDIEKEPTITNTGKNDAWVWAEIAIPAALNDTASAADNVIHFNMSGASVADGQWDWWDDKVPGEDTYMVKKDVDIDGVLYDIYTVQYETALKPGETTAEPVIYKVYLDRNVDIDPEGNWAVVKNGNVTPVVWNSNTNGNPVIYVSAYAAQVEGFADVYAAYDAYQAQWGDNGGEYDTDASIEVNVGTADAVNEALASGNDIVLTEDVDLNAQAVVEAGKKVTVDLNEKTLTGNYLENNGELVVNSGDMKIGTATDYAVISLSDSETVLNDVDVTAGGGGIGAVGGAQVTINGGSVNVAATTTNPRYNIYAEGNGTVVTVNGGEYSFTVKTLKRAYIYAGAGTTVYVNDGTFGTPSTRSGYTAGILGPGKVIITGGTFGFNPSSWVADGYVAVEDTVNHVWTVSAQ